MPARPCKALVGLSPTRLRWVCRAEPYKLDWRLVGLSPTRLVDLQFKVVDTPWQLDLNQAHIFS